MKKYLPVLFGLISLSSTFALGALQKLESAQFERDGVRYEIQTSFREIFSPHTFEDHEIAYSIKANGKFIHRGNRSGGTLTGCRYSKELPKSVLSPIKVDALQVGWLLKTGGTCGNTFSFRAQLIILPKGTPNGYLVRTIHSKTEPKWSLESPGKINLNYIYQEWGRGGTASSFFVPVFSTIDINATGDQVIQEVKAPKDFKQWPSFGEGYSYTLASYLVAGINSWDGSLIRSVAPLLTSKDEVHLKDVGLPSSTQEILNLAEGIEKSGNSVSQFSNRISRGD